MRIALICDPEERPRADELAGALPAAGLESELLDLPGPDSNEPGAALANHLRAVEAALAAGAFDAVVLIGDGDRPLAGVLVATKALVPAIRVASGDPGANGNGQLVERLADHLVPAGAPGAVEAIQAALGAT